MSVPSIELKLRQHAQLLSWRILTKGCWPPPDVGDVINISLSTSTSLTQAQILKESYVRSSQLELELGNLGIK